MLTEISIENFKAFGKKQRIPLKPITLLYGPNSSGKSSFLQALLMLKQTVEMPGDQENILLSRGHYVDLGGYQEFINNHDKRKEFKFGTSFNFGKYGSHFLNINTLFSAAWPTIGDPLSIEFTFTLEDSHEILVKEVKIFQKLGTEPIATYKNVWFIPKLRKVIQLQEEKDKQGAKPITVWRSHLKKTVLVLESMNFKNKNLIDDLDGSIYFYGGDVKNVYLEDIQFMREKVKSIAKKRLKYIKDKDIKGEELKQKEKKWENALEFVETLNDSYNNHSYDKLFKLKAPPFDRLISLSRCLPKALLSGDEELFKNIEEFNLLGSLDFELHGGENHTRIIQTGLIIFLSELLSYYLRQAVYVGPLRALPERVYTFSGSISSSVGKSGEHMPDILYNRPDVRDKVNEWLSRVVGYEIKVEPMKGDVFEISLKDGQTKCKATPKDVGFGVSQLLPIIVQGIVARNNIICIEQPEIHIHPCLQAELGSFLAANIKTQPGTTDEYAEEEPGNQFIIETHSENLILRLQKLIRKGELAKDDVAVIYFDKTPEGTVAQELRLNDRGEFIDPWPHGFFEESFEEMFG